MKLVIMAGGKGTRVSEISVDIPKPLIKVEGIPVLERQILLAKKYGIREIIICIGYLGQKIKDYFGDGSDWDIMISYHQEDVPLGSAGALGNLRNQLNEDFLLFYGDIIMEFNIQRMIDYHKRENSDSTLLVHPNDHPFDSDLIETNHENHITSFLLKPHNDALIYKNLVNAGVYILSPKMLSLIPENQKSDLVSDILIRSIEEGFHLFAYNTPEYIKDMGTPIRFTQVCEDISQKKLTFMSLDSPQKAIFMDRDGVINEEVDLLHDINKIELIDGVVEAIKLINKSNFMAIVITNQPVIARNLCSLEELDDIHKKLETLLGNQGAFINAIYFCPHHPDGGFPEERKEYKIKCECRKPAPGMFFSASNEWNIKLDESYMIGDHQRDINAGKNAGLKESFLIETNSKNALLDQVKSII
ncbi:MAG: D,D-heptose 1,7-bisphosphate phosphatase [Chloroflexi bacterium]|nr:D,D-heptose 1,7-bisphosphate phosphatase [Chloroflexota bacterium]|tara:strand:+ start:509 stop:1759 length:1251 start_codon:yes stop_codon:yes gene_type:complete